jgi:hypothetical protein
MLGGRDPFAQLASQLFFRLQLFFAEVEVSEEKILKRNPAEEKRAGSEVDHPPSTSNRSMDELSRGQS